MISGSLTLNSSWPPFSNLSFPLHLHPLSYQPFDKLRTGFQPSAISWKLYELRVISSRSLRSAQSRKRVPSFAYTVIYCKMKFEIRNSKFEITSLCPLTMHYEFFALIPQTMNDKMIRLTFPPASETIC